MPLWAWLILAFSAGVLATAAVGTRVRRVIREAPSPELPESCAPGWYVCCTRCGRTRTLAQVGGIRLGGNTGAAKVTLGWCRGCRGLRVIRVVHKMSLGATGSSGEVEPSDITSPA